MTFFTILLFCFSSAAQPLGDHTRPDIGDENSAIIELLKAETVAFFAKDYKAWAETWTQSKSSVAAWNTADGGYAFYKGWDEINDIYKEMIMANKEIDYPSFDVSDLLIEISGNLAVITSNEYIANKEMMYSKVPGYKVVKKIDGKWKLHTMITFWDRNFQYSKAQVAELVKDSAYKSGNYGVKN